MVYDGILDVFEVEGFWSEERPSCQFGKFFDPLIDHVKELGTVDIILSLVLDEIQFMFQ